MIAKFFGKLCLILNILNLVTKKTIKKHLKFFIYIFLTYRYKILYSKTDLKKKINIQRHWNCLSARSHIQT